MRRACAKTAMVVAIVAASTVAICRPGLAKNGYAPLEARVAEADLVVVGKLETLGAAIQIEGLPWQTGTIEIAEVLKGRKATKQATLAWPELPEGRRVANAPVTYRAGTDGVWILRKSPDADAYTAPYRGDRQAPTQKAKVVAVVARLAELKWGEAVDGVSLAVLVTHRSMKEGSAVRIRGKRVDVKESLEALVLARNTSEKAIQLLDYPLDGAVTLSVVDPDGQPMRVALYPQFRAGYVLKLNRYHLTSVPAGGIVCLQHTRLPMSPKTGVFKIGATYANQRDATALKATVWKGKIEAPALNEKVP